MSTDRFGNVMDPSVGYARGSLLSSSAAEIRRLRHAQKVTAQIVETRGVEAIGVFTGNPRYFPLRPDDLNTYCEEWVGPGLFAEELAEAAVEHFGGGETVAVVNRTSAGIVAAILALSGGKTVVSIVPDGDRSHASVIRGCHLASVALVEIECSTDPSNLISEHAPALVVVTTVTSTLARMSDVQTQKVIQIAKQAGATVFMDEAYGARLRPVLHEGAKSLSMSADFAITNADKAGLSGPRAGILCGVSEPVLATLAKASELGSEARAPIAAGAMRSLQAFVPEDLRTEARDGATIADALAPHWEEAVVQRSDLGPMLDEQDVFARVLSIAGRDDAEIVPAEATAAIGLLLLRRRGALTVNTHGAPGGRVSLRLKPTAGALAAVNGAETLTDAIEEAIDEVARNLSNLGWFSQTLFGDAA